MQHPLSQPTKNFLSPPKKPVTFGYPLARPEIKTGSSIWLGTKVPVNNNVEEKEYLLPPLEKGSSETLVSPNATEQKTDGGKSTDETTSPKRRLADEIKEIFASGSISVDKKDLEQPPTKNERRVFDTWDRALLFGENSSAMPLVFVPKKADMHVINAAFPTRIVEETPLVNKTSVPSVLNIPVKPKEAVLPKNFTGSPLASIPLSDQMLNPNNGSSTSQSPIALPSMSEILVEKIITGQIKSVLEGAPPTLQKNLEKTPIREILSPNNENGVGNVEDNVWKERLREYLQKLQKQAEPIFSDPSMVNYKEGELVLDYIKRVYPGILGAQVAKKD